MMPWRSMMRFLEKKGFNAFRRTRWRLSGAVVRTDVSLPKRPDIHSYLSTLPALVKMVSQKSESRIWISSGVMRTIGPTFFTLALDCNCHFRQVTLSGKRRTIFLVQVLNIKDEFALEIDVIVEFVPPGDGSELWPGKFGKRVKIETVDGEANQVHESGQGGRQQRINDVRHGESGWHRSRAQRGRTVGRCGKQNRLTWLEAGATCPR